MSRLAVGCGEGVKDVNVVMVAVNDVKGTTISGVKVAGKVPVAGGEGAIPLHAPIKRICIRRQMILFKAVR